MTDISIDRKSVIPDAIVESVKASIDHTCSYFFSEKPVLVIDSTGHHEGPCIAGIISFVGQIPWSLSWILTARTAPAVAKKFAGFDIAFDSDTMGDMTGELVNVIAGEVISQMEQRDIKGAMSLPTVARGSPLELVPEQGPSIVYLQYSTSDGPFWFRLAAAKHYASRLSGT